MSVGATYPAASEHLVLKTNVLKNQMWKTAALQCSSVVSAVVGANQKCSKEGKVTSFIGRFLDSQMHNGEHVWSDPIEKLLQPLIECVRVHVYYSFVEN